MTIIVVTGLVGVVVVVVVVSPRAIEQLWNSSNRRESLPLRFELHVALDLAPLLQFNRFVLSARQTTQTGGSNSKGVNSRGAG